MREVDAALSQHDALILPTLPIVAPPIGAASVNVGTSTEPVRNVMLRLTQLFNVTGHPAISIPAAPSSTGLPCGIQLVGCRHQTDALLKVARHEDSRKCFILLAEILETPGLADRLLQVLKEQSI